MIKHLCHFILLILIIAFSATNIVSAQQRIEWVDISLIDTSAYVKFAASSVENHKYPPSNLFDAKLNTCWVCGSENKRSDLFLRLPDFDNIVLNIFSGYGKSRKLYYQNARPRKIRVTVYGAVNPDGYVSEFGAQYKAVRFPREQIIHPADSFGIHSVMLDFSQNDLTDFVNRISKSFDSEYNLPKAETCLIVKIEILESYAGSKYADVCISEVFFNDRFVISKPAQEKQVLKVYLNNEENTLLLDNNVNKSVVIYSDTSSVLQIIEISENKKWAILMSMPAHIEGRLETSYLLIDLINEKMANPEIEKYTGNYLSGDEIYFDSKEREQPYLMYHAKDGDYYRLELR